MRSAVAVLAGVAAAVLAGLSLAFLGNGLHGVTGWAALIAGVAVAVAAFMATPRSAARHPSTFWDWVMIVAFAVASARAFFWLLYQDGDSWKVLSPNNLGDLALHISFINWFAATPEWWPSSPILAGDPLRYPPGSDLFNALLLTVGVPVTSGLIWCGIVGAALAGYALWRWGGTVALAAFLFNGGLAGFTILHTGWGADPDATTEWKNLFLTLFVTQRGFLFALPAGLLLLAAWREAAFGNSDRKLIPLPLQVLLLGSMPLFSIHTALFLGVAMAGLFFLAPSSRRLMSMLALLAWPPMAFFGWLVTSGCGGPSAAHALGLAPGWMADGTLRFWIWNFGIALPLALLLCGVLSRRGGDREARAFVWPAAMVFVLCMVVRFAPWPWDNMKLMLWSWLVVAPYLWIVLLEKRPLIPRACAAFLLFGSGAVTLALGLDSRHGYEMVKPSDLHKAAAALKGIPAGDVIACAPDYNQPVLVLGHPVVCGYEGHLWSHGLDYKKRWEILESIMKGEPDWRGKAKKLGVSYIYWGDLEAKRWPESKLPWAQEEATPALHRLK